RGSRALSLARGEVHVWRAWLDPREAQIDRLGQALSPDERSRAGSFVFERDRNRFRVSRGVLRHVLAGYLDAAPAEIAFRYGDLGKPELGAIHHKLDVKFNTSHSNNVALFAVTRGRRVGVDVEHIRPVADV